MEYNKTWNSELCWSHSDTNQYVHRLRCNRIPCSYWHWHICVSKWQVSRHRLISSQSCLYWSGVTVLVMSCLHWCLRPRHFKTSDDWSDASKDSLPFQVHLRAAILAHLLISILQQRFRAAELFSPWACQFKSSYYSRWCRNTFKPLLDL